MTKLKTALIVTALTALVSTAFATNQAQAAAGEKVTVAEPGADTGARKAHVAKKKHMGKHHKAKHRAKKPL